MTRRLRAGLTLLELVVALALFAMVALVITKVFLNVSDVQRKIYLDQNIEGDLRYAINVLADEAKKASLHGTECDSYCSGCLNKYFCTATGPGMPPFTKVCLNEGGSCVQYYLSGGQLVVQRASATYTITSTDVVIDKLEFKTDLVDATEKGNTLEVFARAKNKEADGNPMLFQTAITNNP